MSLQDNKARPLSTWPTTHLSFARTTTSSTAKATSFIIHRSQKRANHWCRWSEDVIPCMIVPYLSYIQETVLLHHASNITGCRTCSIKVACVFFDSMKSPSLPALLQLLHCGFFFHFVHLLFLHQSPNQMAWCDALETFLDGMKYNLWHRFSNAFHWYQVLTVLAQNHISMLIIGFQKDDAPMDQPSDYLRSWLPLCFGGNDWPDVIICIDTCFTQKCSANPCGATGSDPPNTTSFFFLPTDNVKAMEDFVERCCRDRQQSRTSRVEPDEDSYEEGMHIPWEKASTHFFTNTVLMALVCRHDHVLWIVNLMSAGENCHKWNFLDNSTLSHITFAVAVFHVYGHQWLCQIVYHPRNFLKPLISSLRVSGQLFVLDTQIRHLDLKSLQGFGHLLHWCWIHCQSKKNDALDHLHELELDDNMLRVEWKAQCAYCLTECHVGQSRNKAVEVITIILALEKMLQTQEASIRELKMQLHAVHVPNIGEVNLQLVDAQSHINLEKMKKDIYLTVCLNARTIKTHICDRLHQQKFELERLERLYRATVNAERKLHPGILKLITTYNVSTSFCCSPYIIPCDGIFQLNVDDDIWQDVGLDDDTLNPPAWLLDDKVRNGIWLQLEVDHCNEEEVRLMQERAILQEWMLVEWDSTQTALNKLVTDPVMSFHLRSHADELVNICIFWRKKVQCILCMWPMIALVQAAFSQARLSFWDENDDDKSLKGDKEGNGESDLEYGEIEDEELMDAIEEIALADEYRYDQNKELVDDLDDLDDINNNFMPSFPIKLLHKWRNM
ncbi:hypothetical protein BDR05DRAFT_978650 [Suillus weaverae]|nr:hypothetical protein BDR05DRAFT_978650 [Suillus weaverae]